jgi:hypothetical protein
MIAMMRDVSSFARTYSSAVGLYAPRTPLPTKINLAPTVDTPFATAIIENDGATRSSPEPMLRDRSAMNKEAKPLQHGCTMLVKSPTQ